MSSTASSGATVVSPAERVEVLFDELAELAGQRNGIDGRIVEIVAELDRDELCGATGARSIAALVAWKMGSSIGERQHDRHRRAPAGGVPALRPRHARGPTVAGSGRRHRRPRRRRIRCPLCRAGQGRHGQPAAHRGQAGTAPRTRTRSILGPSRSARSPRPPTSSSAATGSNLVTPTPRSSTRRCSRIMMR